MKALAAGRTVEGKRDFPFYAGAPMSITGPAWLVVLASVVAAFLLLILLPFHKPPLNILPAALYTSLPLLALAVVSRGHHTALFGQIGPKQFGQAVGFGLLTVITSLAVGFVLIRIVAMKPNASTDILAAATGPLDIAVFMIRTFIQLIGEEVMTIVPLLAVLWFCVAKLNLSRTVGLVLGVIISTAWFAAVHLPTYNWNIIQCFGGIGTARLVLTAAYLVTRNLWLSAGAHIVNDWTEFFGPLALAGLAGHTPIEPGA